MDALSQSEEPRPASGLWSSTLGLLGLIVDAVYTRLELLFVDLQEGVERLVGLLIWSLVALCAASMTLLLGALALIFAFWDTHRVLVAASITGLFALLALLAFGMVVAVLRNGRALFAATLQEFARDRAHLRVRPESVP